MKWAILLLIAGLVLLFMPTPATANHLRWLPGTCGQDVRTCPTPVIKRARDRGYVTYAFDAQAAAYPNFKTQALNVAFAGKDAGLPEAREVDSSPDIWLTMPDDATFISACRSGAAGCILYWNDPIIVYYRRALLYSDWRTTISHEGLNYGHALGQHERYFDNGEFRCDTTATYTVMSCGTGVWRPQPFDIETVCAVLKTSWCGKAPDCGNPCWDGTIQPFGRWQFADGWSYEPQRDWWWNPANVPEWMAVGCCNDRWNDVIKRWVGADGSFYDPLTGIRSKKP